MAKKLSFKEKSVDELEKMLAEKRDDLQKLRFEAAGGRVKNPNELGAARRDIARILTELGARAKVAQ